MLTGQFGGEAFYDNAVVTIAADGRTATVHDDGTLGPTTSSCTVTAFTADGLGTVACTFTSGPANGASYAVHYVYTDGGRNLGIWLTQPAAGLYASGILTRP